jgi:hypothetical protein
VLILEDTGGEVEMILQNQPDQQHQVSDAVLQSQSMIQRGRVVTVRLRSCVLVVQEPYSAARYRMVAWSLFAIIREDSESSPEDSRNSCAGLHP